MTVSVSCRHQQLSAWLSEQGFTLLSREEFGCIYQRKEDTTCLIIDTIICELQDHPYVAYTTKQNELMVSFNRVFRFLLDSSNQAADLQQLITLFLSDESDPEKIKRFGGNRTEQEPDPTLPEAAFEDCFLEAFGDRARMALHREFAYIDLEGVTRYIDYALFGQKEKFAIELNGESFHHPAIIGPARYRSQLFKQNSLVADGFKVFRWSLNGMRDQERFILELRRFMGDARPFNDKSIVKLTRQLKTFTLHRHQEQALQQLDGARQKGQNNFLLVLPTGTGKTEIFIVDLVRLKERNPTLRALVIVPTHKLRKQTISRLQLRLPPQLLNEVSQDPHGNDAFVVQTTAYLHRHYYTLAADRFDYIVVDEAHHAPAQSLRNILEHFCPTHLVGVTATPERLDQQRLEDIFGEYEPQLSLQEAIEQGLVPPVRCYRIKSNVDLSEVRFNGKEYVKNDLQRTLLVPSRDQLIVDVTKCYFGENFSSKQGVVFCVDIKHARRMATLFNGQGLSALAVDGRDRKVADQAQQAYDNGDVRFLCACDLLTEGWDAPQTSILIMARPTFSKVLYSQQLGRGLRNHPGKEALYVIDVVDNYGARLQPLTLHALFKIPNYQPFSDLIAPKERREGEILVLDGLYEGERRIEPVDIFTFEETYGSYLNEEQLARELFVSTGTVKVWLKREKIKADVQYPFGRKKLSFFHPDKVADIRKEQGLKEHTAETRGTDFKEFLEKRDYTFSYKIIFLLAFLKVANERFEAHLPDILNLYLRFYKDVLAKHEKNERPNCPYNRADYLEDSSAVQRSLLANPFEKFERKRFLYHCKDLNYLALDPELIKSLGAADYQQIRRQMDEDLISYYDRLEIDLVEQDYYFLLPEDDGTKQQESVISLIENPAEEQKYNQLLPIYPLDIAAGEFMDSETQNEPEGWCNVDGLTTKAKLSPDMFVAQVQGHSMEPHISDGAYCLFTFNTAGSRQGRIVLAQKADISDQDTGASFTIKTYRSTKKVDPDSGWQHESITLEPSNKEYDDITIPADEADDFRVVAFFMERLLA